ncbi:CinA family nicotinamide mononucleotide deamidase-related protein [Estrella lausannensis]|uniref:CinA-like protein n=1 Tax=Estrella lausannensis TaxID=483423 RepID=A0A0H5DRC9_9BACT|nr:CinA family nicotinamide mononucleotide deamidase-related protein [Estrella lausannensis]CRX38738.1 Competence-damage inducible protein [Estrella lausannensis]
MKAEIIAIGDELLSGFVLNTNMQHIAKALLIEGCFVQRGWIVRDKLSDIKDAVEAAMERSDLVIATGGLGPTIDDLTREAACQLFDTTLVLNPYLQEALVRKYGALTDPVRNQATQPKEAKILSNPVGSAPGLLFERKGKMIFFLPGPPIEMTAVFDEGVIPLIRARVDSKGKWQARWLYFSLMKESDIDPLLHEVQKEYPELCLGIYPAPGLVSVSIKGLNEEEISRAMEKFQAAFPQNVITLEKGSLSLTCKKIFDERGMTLAAAESLTGGLLGEIVTRTPGASSYFLGSVVAYSNQLKKALLEVNEDTLASHGAVSEAVAKEMAEGVRKIAGSSIGVSLTGIAGPSGGSSEKPVGTYFAAITDGTRTKVWKRRAPGTRQIITEWAVNDMLASLYHWIIGSHE